jgi:hypothetical protein
MYINLRYYGSGKLYIAAYLVGRRKMENFDVCQFNGEGMMIPLFV